MFFKKFLGHQSKFMELLEPYTMMLHKNVLNLL